MRNGHHHIWYQLNMKLVFDFPRSEQFHLLKVTCHVAILKMTQITVLLKVGQTIFNLVLNKL